MLNTNDCGLEKVAANSSRLGYLTTYCNYFGYLRRSFWTERFHRSGRRAFLQQWWSMLGKSFAVSRVFKPCMSQNILRCFTCSYICVTRILMVCCADQSIAGNSHSSLPAGHFFKMMMIFPNFPFFKVGDMSLCIPSHLY